MRIKGLFWIIVNLEIEELTKRIKSLADVYNADVVITTITGIFNKHCERVFGYFKRGDVKTAVKINNDIIYVEVLMEDSLYSRKLGKYILEQRVKILEDLKTGIRLELEKVNWKEVLEKSIGAEEKNEF